MRRREVIALCSGAALWRSAAGAQQASLPVVGFLGSITAGVRSYLVPAVSQGLEAAGFAAGRNVVVEYRWARDYGELPDLAEHLVRRNPAVIITDGTPATLAARRASQTIPVVFMIGRDPVELGLVGAINRPDNNLTGFMMFNDLLTTKRLELLHEIVPNATI